MDLTQNKPKAYRTGEKTKTIVYKYGNLNIVEICDINSGILIARKQRENSLSGKNNEWEWTYGAPHEANTDKSLAEATQNPIFMRTDTETHFQWYVKYIPYPTDNYDISVNEEANNYIIKTKNKKYFKIVHAPDSIHFNKNLLEWAWTKNTLIIRYPKTKEDIEKEKEERKFRLSIPLEEENDPNCRT